VQRAREAGGFDLNLNIKKHKHSMIPLHQVPVQFEAFASLLWSTVPQTATPCDFGESLEVLLYALNQPRLCRRAGGAFKRSSLRLDL